MNAPGGSSRGGFTLLESIIALAMIGAVAGACLQVRAQSLAGRQRLTVRQTTDRGFETILRLAQSGLLVDGDAERDEEGATTRITWAGEHLNEPFVCERRRVEMNNPISGVGSSDASAPSTIVVWRWTVQYRNETAELITPARSAP